MCAINGIFAYGPAAPGPEERELIATRDHMARRGPDGAGVWIDERRRIGFGHRRLSIIDLSSAGAQPMHSACGRYVVVFNGEIYNYPELKRSLEAQGRTFVSGSDTEALLHLYALRGPDMVNDLRGMFAFAIWDTLKRTLFLARDPHGIKPLYVSDRDGVLRFASQVKALMHGGAVSSRPDPAGAVGFFLWGSVPEPFTLYEAVQAFPAGHWQLIDDAGPRPAVPFASLTRVYAESGVRRGDATLEEIVRATVSKSVAAHLLADVEVGVFLSAGIDSGAVLGLMRDAGQAKIRAVTLSFAEYRDTREDEAPLARSVADVYGAQHLVRTVDAAEFRADLPRILSAMDQPSIDGVNTWFVSKAAAELGLKVALSGVGGDEVLAGYPSFRDIPLWTSRLGRLSRLPGLATTMRKVLDRIGIGRRVPKLAGLLEYASGYERAYLLRRSLFLPFEFGAVLEDPEMVREGLRRLAPIETLGRVLTPDPGGPLARVSVLESTHYMRNQLLRDTDWASMAHSLEVRTPLVDIEVSRALAPYSAEMGNGAGKQALAQAPGTPLPAAVTDRAKTGFAIPTGLWVTDKAARAAAQGTDGAPSKATQSRTWARDVYTAFTRPAPALAP